MVASLAADHGGNRGRVDYRDAGRGKSRQDFIAHVTAAEEKADEASYWLDCSWPLGRFRTRGFGRSCRRPTSSRRFSWRRSRLAERIAVNREGWSPAGPGCRLPPIVAYSLEHFCEAGE